MSGDVEAMPGRKDQVEQTEESAILMSTSHLPTHITRPLLIPSPLLFRWNQLVLSAMRVVVIPRVIFRLTPLAARQAVAPCRGHLRWSTALRPGSLVDGIRLCLSISRCLRLVRDCPSSSGTGYSVPSRALGVQRTVPPLRGCGMRRRLPHPFVLACSHKAHPLGSSAEADDYNSTFPRSRFHGLGCPWSFDSLAPGSARPFGSRHSGIYPGLSQGPVLPRHPRRPRPEGLCVAQASSCLPSLDVA